MTGEQWTPPESPDITPLVALREILAGAREAGDEFPAAWPVACSRILRTVHDHRERSQWRAALNRTEETWQRAYERQPEDEIDRQLTLVGSERDEPVIRECGWCGASLEGRHGRVKFCNDLHRKRDAQGVPYKAAA